MAVRFKEQCKKCFHFQVCANVLQNDLFIREVMLGEKDPKCKQFVEVVRCKDCKNYCKVDALKGKILDFHWCKQFRNITKPDDFCSYGERREGE